MCQIVDFSACGHRDTDRSHCTNPYPVTKPCKPILTDLTLASECYRCREAYLSEVAKRPSVKEFAREAARAAARAALNTSTAAPSLFAWPGTASWKQRKLLPRRPLSSDQLEDISGSPTIMRDPESPTIVKEERGWSPGPRMPLPCQPTTGETAMVPIPQVTLTPAPAHRVSYPYPQVVSTAQKTVGLPPALEISIPKPLPNAPPPQIISTPQPKERAPSQVSSIQEEPANVSVADTAPAPTPAVRSRPNIDRSSNRLKPRPRSTRLRDAYQGVEASHTPEVAPPVIQRKPLPPYPAWTTLPSQVGERARGAGEVWKKTQSEWDQRQIAHTPKQELFLATPVKEIQPDQGGLPSCLQVGDRSQADDLTRVSTLFKLFSETGRESSTKCETPKPAPTPTTSNTRNYNAYPRAQAVKSTSEILAQSYAAHEASRQVPVEFVDRKPTTAPTPTPTTYNTETTNNPDSKLKRASQFPATVLVEFEAAESCRDRPLTVENSLSELSTALDVTSKSCQDSSVEFVCAKCSERGPSATTNATTTTPSQAGSLSELSAIFNMETCGAQIELEGYSRPSTASEDCKTLAWLNSVGSYDCYNPLKSTAEVVSELPETIMDTMPQPELPSVTPLPAMTFGGTTLEGVFGNWSWSS
ncbi:hypothetical protein DL95DRAFT_488929 [Leptodontidium sp. 2 PMI_412]|nr:hypothetical protein DL95DRAFT_488929 [Leptodontidium sp. 2 PMI_412]